MRKTLLVIAMAFAISANAQTWKMDKGHSNVGFSVVHMMLSDVEGKFTDFDATITASKEDLSDAKFTMTAQIASIDTDNERRDGHLKSADYFDAEKFPTLNFVSTSFKKVEGKKYKMVGNLTMHGVTKPVTFDVTMNGPIEHPRSKKMMIGLKVSGNLDRTAFGVGDSPEAMLSHNIELRASGEFTKE